MFNPRELHRRSCQSSCARAALAALSIATVAWAQPPVGTAKAAAAPPPGAAPGASRAQDLLARAALDNIAVIHGRSVSLRGALGRSASRVISWQNALAEREASIFATALPFSAPAGSGADATTSIVHFGGPRGSHTTLRVRAGALTSSGAGQSARSLLATAQLLAPAGKAASAWTASERPSIAVTSRADEEEWDCPGTNRKDGIANAEETGSFTVTRSLGPIPIETDFTVDLNMEAFASDNATLRFYHGDYVFRSPGGGSYEGSVAGTGNGVAIQEGHDSNDLQGYLQHNPKAAADVAAAVRDWARVETHDWAQRAFGRWDANGGCLTVDSGVNSVPVQPIGATNLSVKLIAPLVKTTGKKGKHRAPKPRGTVEVSATGSIRATPAHQKVTGNKPFKIKIIRPFDSTAGHSTRPSRTRDHSRARSADDGPDTVTVQAQTNDGRAQLVIPVQPVLPMATVLSLSSSEGDTASGGDSGASSSAQDSYVAPDAVDGNPTTCSDDVCHVSLVAQTSHTETDTGYRNGDSPCQDSEGPLTTTRGWPFATLNLHFDNDGGLTSADVYGGPNEEIGGELITGGLCDVLALGTVPWVDVPVSVAALNAGQAVSVSLNDSGSGPTSVSNPPGMTLSTSFSLQATFKLNGPLVQDIGLPGQPSP